MKSAFTRAYNKESGKNPYAVTNVKKKKKGSATAPEEELGEEDLAVESEEEDDSLENDAMIKVDKGVLYTFLSINLFTLNTNTMLILFFLYAKYLNELLRFYFFSWR